MFDSSLDLALPVTESHDVCVVEGKKFVSACKALKIVGTL